MPSRPSGSSSSPSARPARPGPRPSSRCATSATPPQSSSVAASKASLCRPSSPRVAELRPTRSPDPVTAATKASLSSLAHRIQALDDELAELDARIEALLVATVPELLDVFGVGPDTAAALVMAAGDNPERLRSEAAWAHLCGVAPVPKGSGKTNGKVQAHDGGDRQANSALWRIVMVRIAHDPDTQLYFERRVKEGKTKAEVIRILKRYVARELYRYLPRG